MANNRERLRPDSSIKEEVQKKAMRIFRNLFLLSLIIVFLRAIQPNLTNLPNTEILGFTITKEVIFELTSMLFIIYFGYNILTDTKFFLDLTNKYISTRLMGKERSIAKNISNNIIALIYLVLASELLVPIISLIPNYGELFAGIIKIIFIFIGFFMVYDLANEVYRLMKNRLDRFIDEVSKNHLKE
jgi:ABC-type multidrug transport system fused ATPase/permease subunit